MRIYQTFSIVLVILFFNLLNPLSAQDKMKLDHTVYDDWKDIASPIISNDGQFVAYEINPQKGDGLLYLYEAEPKNYIEFDRGIKPTISSGSNFMVFNIRPQYDTVRKAKLAKVKKDKLPKDSIAIYSFGDKKLRKYPEIKNFQLPEDDTDWLAFLMKKPIPPKKDSDTTELDKQKDAKKGKKKKEENDLLVIMNPITGDSIAFDQVSKYAVAKNGSNIVFVQATNDSIDSVYVSRYDTKSMNLTSLYSQAGYTENVCIDQKGLQIAFTYSADTSENKMFELVFIDLKNESPIYINNENIQGIPANWTVSKNAKLYFNDKGNELYFGTALKPEPKAKDTLTADEKVSLDIWNWKDPLLQTHQLKDLKKEQKRTYAAVWFPEANKAIQLGNEGLRDVVIDKKTKGKYSIGYDKREYQKMLTWDASRYKDVYLVDRTNGTKHIAIEKAASSVSMSPEQDYIAWYNIADSAWYIYDTEKKAHTNVTSAIAYPFYNELNDIPNEARPYGMAGWTKKQKLVLYDQFDLWLIDPTGKNEAVCITNGEGRKRKLKYRYVRLDKEERFLPEEMMLSAFNIENKQSGFFKFDVDKQGLKGLTFGPYRFKQMKKAKDAYTMIWRQESFTQFPELYMSDLVFNNTIQLTDANPQQADYNWGTTELVEWMTFDGDTMQGILVKPENFDPNKKYPMLVYFYERVSDRLNSYYMPKPIRSVINWTYYASNEYLIFIPDIKYRTGYPGPSAYDCIVSGTQTMCNRYAFVDRENLGIQGQSWGGYQTAYVITQTNMFKAAMAGAPVSNMTSAYGGIRWGSGLSRAFQYEESQSRIGGNLWENRDLYILNSPLFFADKIESPLLIMHNDDDGAVPWYQGIEFFNALRRLDKPVWMLVYNKAPHNLKRRADMEDLTLRMQQFFDHYLKDAPEPVWMKTGVPAIEKGKEFGFGMGE